MKLTFLILLSLFMMKTRLTNHIKSSRFVSPVDFILTQSFPNFKKGSDVIPLLHLYYLNYFFYPEKKGIFESDTFSIDQNELTIDKNKYFFYNNLPIGNIDVNIKLVTNINKSQNLDREFRDRLSIFNFQHLPLDINNFPSKNVLNRSRQEENKISVVKNKKALDENDPRLLGQQLFFHFTFNAPWMVPPKSVILNVKKRDKSEPTKLLLFKNHHRVFMGPELVKVEIDLEGGSKLILFKALNGKTDWKIYNKVIKLTPGRDNIWAADQPIIIPEIKICIQRSFSDYFGKEGLQDYTFKTSDEGGFVKLDKVLVDSNVNVNRAGVRVGVGIEEEGIGCMEEEGSVLLDKNVMGLLDDFVGVVVYGEVPIALFKYS